MTSVEQAGLMAMVVVALIVLGWGGRDHGSRIRNADEDQWWYRR